jgi:hypothetical protein
MQESILAERQYELVDHGDSVSIRIFTPVLGEGGSYCCRVSTIYSGETKDYFVSTSEDPWSAIDLAFIFAKTLVSRIHRGSETVILNGKRSALWI